MYILISIVFIAELIIAIATIALLSKINKLAIDLNQQVLAAKDYLITGLASLKLSSDGMKKGVCKFFDFMETKKRHYLSKVVQNIILYIFMFFCKGKYKRAAIIFQLIVAIRDYIRDSKI